MKSTLMRLGIIFILLANYLSSVFAQGVLTFEISDTLNAPVVGLEVKVVNEDGIGKNYITDANGRVIDSECSVGKYTYSFNYGDYNTGSFEITSGEYTWVNLDYRRVSINFADSKGTPQKGRNVKFYIRDEEDNKTLIAERESNENGRSLFIVPAGKYTYQTINEEKDIIVEDENINTTIEVSGSLVTHATFFEFQCEGAPIKLKSNDVRIQKKDNGEYVAFGVAQGSITGSGISTFSRTVGNVSCPAGEYKYTVYINTFDDSKEGEFIVKDDDSITELVIPIDVTSLALVEEGDESTYLDPDKDKPLFNLTLKITNCEDKTEPLEHVMTRCVYPRRGLTSMIATNEEGISQFSLNEGTYHIVVPGDTLKDFNLTSDTTVEICLYKTLGTQAKTYHQLYIGFKKGNKTYYPQDINKIVISGGRENISLTPKLDTLTNLKKFSDPLYLLEDKSWYYYSFHCDDVSYDESFSVSHKNRIDTLWINLKDIYKIQIRVIHNDSTPVKSIFRGEIVSGRTHYGFGTDTTGFGSKSLEQGKIDISVAGYTIDNFYLDRDTTVYLVLPDTRNVWFQFLHDGEEIYPSITNSEISIYKPGMTGYNAFVSARTESSRDCNKGNYCYKFEKPVSLPNGEYILEYDISSLKYRSNRDDSLGVHHIHINVPPIDKDTTIYIVVPYKYTATIHLTDANGTDIQGVYGKIFKYDENGELGTNNKFDGSTHSNLRTDSKGNFTDHLLPGRYQLQILDIVRDFEISDYSLAFAILSDVEKYNVKYKILNKETKEPVSGLKLETKKEGSLYSISKSDANGEINVQCEIGEYTYQLMYGDAQPVAYTIQDQDETFTILVDNIVMVEDIEIKAPTCIENGSSFNIKTQAVPSDASIKEIKMSLNTDLLATLTTSGLLTANKYNAQGDVTITAKATDGSNVSKTITVQIGGCEVAPDPILVSEIALSAEECVNNGESTQITATVAPDDATSKEVTFSVDDETLATISADGKLTANIENKGDVTVTAKATDGSNVSKSVTVKIGGCEGEIIPQPEPVLVTNITLAAADCVNNGESTQITATVAPDNATSKEIVFSVDDATLATISTDGKLTATAENKGDVTVTAKATDGSNVSKTVTVKIGGCEGEIIPQPETILVSNITLTASECVNNGESTQITATVAPDNATSKEITFSVDDETLATISADGKLTSNAENKGDVTVTAKATDGSNVSKSVTVKIGGCEGEIIPQPENILITNIALNAHECLKENEQTQIIATIFPENATNKNLVYSIDDESLATISNTGLLSVTSNGKKGVVTVTVKATDGSDVESTIDINIGGCDFGKYVHIEFENGTASSTVDYNDTVTIRITTSNLIEKDILFVLVSGTDENMRVGNLVKATQLNCYNYYDESEMVCGFHTQEISFVIDSKEDNQYFLVSAFEKFENGYSYYNYVNSNIIRLDVIKPDSIIDNTEIPTVFTPTEIDGANDDFMPGYPVVIYNRVGDVICVSSNGWDGKYKGKLADAGVYIYHVTLKDGTEKRGTIQLYKE